MADPRRVSAARLADHRHPRRSFGRSTGIAVLSGIASLILGAGLGLLPGIAPVGGFLGFLFGILVAAFFLKSMVPGDLRPGAGRGRLALSAAHGPRRFSGNGRRHPDPGPRQRALQRRHDGHRFQRGQPLQIRHLCAADGSRTGSPWTAFPAKGRYRTSTSTSGIWWKSDGWPSPTISSLRADFRPPTRPARRTSPPTITFGAWCSDGGCTRRHPLPVHAQLQPGNHGDGRSPRSNWKTCRRSERTAWWSF